jgi:hypothetical protein
MTASVAICEVRRADPIPGSGDRTRRRRLLVSFLAAPIDPDI